MAESISSESSRAGFPELADRLTAANAVTVTAHDIIADMTEKLGRLSRDIDERWPELDSENVKPWGTLVTVYSQNCVRLGQLMRARRDLREASSSDELDADMDAALACLSEAWGIEL